MLVVPSSPFPSTRVCHIWGRVRALAAWGVQGAWVCGKDPGLDSEMEFAESAPSPRGGPSGVTGVEREEQTLRVCQALEHSCSYQDTTGGGAAVGGRGRRPLLALGGGTACSKEGGAVGRRLQASLFRD